MARKEVLLLVGKTYCKLIFWFLLDSLCKYSIFVKIFERITPKILSKFEFAFDGATFDVQNTLCQKKIVNGSLWDSLNETYRKQITIQLCIRVFSVDTKIINSLSREYEI